MQGLIKASVAAGMLEGVAARAPISIRALVRQTRCCRWFNPPQPHPAT